MLYLLWRMASAAAATAAGALQEWRSRLLHTLP